MSERATLARPYAEAMFDLSRARNELAADSARLHFAAQVASDPIMRAAAADPRLGRERLAKLFMEIGGERFTPAFQNFVWLLIENRRLALLPDIAQRFDRLKADAERRIDVEVISAYPLAVEQIAHIGDVLTRKLGHPVLVDAHVDRALIGGAIIRAGDLVIDGSVRGRLSALASHLTR